MTYAGVQDLIDRWGEAEVRQLAPAAAGSDPAWDVARIDQVLADASAEIDSYLANRYAVPLVEIPPLVIKVACELAREALDRQGRAPVLEAGKRSRAWLKAVARGEATLGTGPGGDAEALPDVQAGGAQVEAPDRVFDDDGLAAFLS